MTITEPLNRDNPSQRRHRGGRQPGHVNYLNDILINIMESLLPNGTKAWCLVPLAYKDESGEDTVCDEDDIHKKWIRKLCNKFKKTTGATGE
jgi:hypothetical protein